MGEAAPCLMRSVSQPFFASCDYKEGDPLRALTTSISFGRFMTEPLDWERWSSFSHNRTLEDVQKYSRPGVVAEKKAFFEAHYKKIAAKKAAKSPKKENKAPNNYSPETDATSPITLSRNLDPKRSNPHSAVDDTGGNESSTLATNIVSSHTNEYMPSGIQVEQEKTSIKNVPSPSTNPVFSQFGDVDDDVPSGSQVEEEKASIDKVYSPSTNQVFRQFGNGDDSVPSGSQVEQEKASIENSPSTNLVFSQFGDDDNVPSGIQMEQEKAPIENVSSPSTNQVFPQFGDVDDDVPSGSQVEQEKASIDNVSSPSTNLVLLQFGDVDDSVPSGSQVEQEKASIENVSSPSTNQVFPQFGNDDDNGRDKVSRQTKPEISSSKSSSKNGAYKLQSPRKAPTPPICPRKAATEKKRSAPISVHMSMNFPPARKNIGLYSSPFSHKNGTSKIIGKPNNRLAQQALTRVSVNGVKKGSQVLLRPTEIGRSKPLLDCSTNGRRTVDMKSLSTNHSEASSLCTKEPRSSSTVPTSFSFRSEERAAKRKEFFQKLEEKSNAKEMGTIQLQPKLKEKARNDNKKLLCQKEIKAPSTRTSGIRAPSNSMQKEKARNDNIKLRSTPALEDKPSTSDTKAPSNRMEKVTQTRPGSPKFGRKPTARLVMDTCYGSPWRSSSSKPKNFIEINKKILSSSMASLPPTKKMYDSTLMSKK